MRLEDLGLSVDELGELKLRCFDARDLSYSPYSKFRVGCTLITTDGEFISGANIENASYGAAICAERTTISKTLIEGKRFKLIAISSDSPEPIAPCGICRQFIREFGEDTPIVMYGANGECKVMGLRELLPMSFGPESLIY